MPGSGRTAEYDPAISPSAIKLERLGSALPTSCVEDFTTFDRYWCALVHPEDERRLVSGASARPRSGNGRCVTWQVCRNLAMLDQSCHWNAA